MRTRTRRTLITEINITPFTDVILVLLIIFMMITPLLSLSAIPVRLPESQKAGDDQVPKSVVITINEAGEAFLEEKQYSLRYDLGILKFSLSSLVKEHPDTSVTINSDSNVKYDFVVKVLDLLNQLGIKRVMLGTEQR